MIKQYLRFLINKLGFDLKRLPKSTILVDNPFIAIQLYTLKQPVIFDIGANIGQTIEKIKKQNPLAIIHSFEPSKKCFIDLKRNTSMFDNLFLNNIGMGAKLGSLEFNEYSWTALNSFLTREYTKSHIVDTYQVAVNTVDQYCKINEIDKINLLKTDTEGFELEVLKGASRMLSSGAIEFILVEVFFNLNFKGQGSFGDIYNLLLQHGFGFVRFYDIDRLEDGRASRTDALFKYIQD